MMFRLFKSFHQNPLHLVTIKQTKLPAQKLLLRLHRIG